VIAAQGIRIYQPPIEADDEATADHGRILIEAIPFSIIGSTEDVQTPDGRVVKGREYLWGVAEGTLVFSYVHLLLTEVTIQWRMRITAISENCVPCLSGHICWI
jgi:hypothetical protein